MGSLEAQVLAELWARPEGATPAEVLQAIGEPLAYTTVMTILTRLWKKGLAERERHGRAFVYRSTVSEADLAAERMRATLETVHDRKATLSLFVGNLSRKDERILRQLLDRARG